MKRLISGVIASLCGALLAQAAVAGGAGIRPTVQAAAHYADAADAGRALRGSRASDGESMGEGGDGGSVVESGHREARVPGTLYFGI